MLRMMQITADAPMMIFLNGQPAGEFSGNAVYLPVGEGALILQAFPMQGGLVPVTARIELSGEDARCVGPDALKVYLLRGSIRVRIGFERIPYEESAMPYILSRLSLGNELYASVYFDRVFCFSLERNGRVILGGGFSQKLSSAEIRRRGNSVVFIGTCAEGKEFFAVDLGREPRVLLHRDARELSVGEELMEYTCRLMAGVFVRERFGLREGRVLSREPERSGASLLAALAAGIREGAEDFSMRLIHPQLRREAGFADFCEFFGDFTDAAVGETGNILELCYETERNVYRVRRLRASIKDEQIANIEELEE